MVATAIPEETEQVINFTIGELASAADVNVETVRYYQRRQLIDLPAKPQHGYRTYPLDTLHKIRFIKRAQNAESEGRGLGFEGNVKAPPIAASFQVPKLSLQ